MSEYDFDGSAPDWVPALSDRDVPQNGEVVDEYGVLQQVSRTYWKTLERIEMEDGRDEIRARYYTENEAKDMPMMLPTSDFGELVERAQEYSLW